MKNKSKNQKLIGTTTVRIPRILFAQAKKISADEWMPTQKVIRLALEIGLKQIPKLDL